jgi:hypothetical protein
MFAGDVTEIVMLLLLLLLLLAAALLCLLLPLCLTLWGWQAASLLVCTQTACLMQMVLMT